VPAPIASNLSQAINFVEDQAPIELIDIVVTDADPGETVTATLTLMQPTAGTLTTSGAATYDAASGVWSITGSVADVNAALAAVSVNLSANWEENFTITTRIRDVGGTGPADGAITFSGSGVNDAPVATTPASIVIPRNVTTDITGVSVSDVDADPDPVTVTLSVPQGALQATSGLGVTVGGTVTALTLTGAVADINAFIAAGEVAYAPVTNATGAVNLTVTVDDGGFNGSGGPQSDTEVVVLQVGNGAPTLDASGSPTLAGLNEDAGPPVNGSTAGSVLVSGLLGGAADANGDIVGAAIEGVSANGVLWYSLDGGASWTQAPTVSSGSALLLGPTARVYFQPGSNFNGSVSDAISYRAWDQTAGASGATASVTSAGAATPFSAEVETASVAIAAVNDAPQISGSGPIVLETGVTNALKGFSISDADAGSTVVTVTVSVTAGELRPNNDIDVIESGYGTMTVTLTGTIANINAYIAGNMLGYLPPDVARGLTLTVTVDDQGASGSGGALQATRDIALQLEREPEPPPPLEGKVVDGVAVRTRDIVSEDGRLIRETEIPPTDRGGPAGGNQSVDVVLDAMRQILASIPKGLSVNVKTPVAAPKAGDLLPTLQISLGQDDGITTSKAFVDRIDRVAGVDPDAPVSVVSLLLEAVEDIRDANSRLVLDGKRPDLGGGPTVAVIDTLRSAIYQNVVNAIEITLQDIDLAIIRGVAKVTGGAGPQIVFGDSASQHMVLGEGHDDLHGGGGDDVVGSEAGNDTLAGDAGLDTVFGGEGHDQLTGGTGADHLHGNQGSDLLHGGEGADTLHGGQGDDAIAGGKDDDIAFGDLGNDRLYGELGADLLRGGDGSDFLHGNVGADTLDGGVGDDLLHGGQDSDSLSGGDGADTLAGDMGDDVLAGGAGADLFLVSIGGGEDRILDFDAAAGDRLRVEAGSAPVARQEGADTVVDLGAGARVVLEGVQISDLPAGWMLLA